MDIQASTVDGFLFAFITVSWAAIGAIFLRIINVPNRREIELYNLEIWKAINLKAGSQELLFAIQKGGEERQQQLIQLEKEIGKLAEETAQRRNDLRAELLQLLSTIRSDIVGREDRLQKGQDDIKNMLATAKIKPTAGD